MFQKLSIKKHTGVSLHLIEYSMTNQITYTKFPVDVCS